MLPSHAHACGYIYLRACGCRDCNTGLPGLLSSQSSSPVLPSSTIAEGTCFPGKKNMSHGINTSKATLQRETWSSGCSQVHPDPTHGPIWRKLVGAMPLLCTGSWRAPKKLCVLTCIQHQRKKPPAMTLGRAGRADVGDPHQSIVVGLLLVVTGAFILLGILRGCCCFLPPLIPAGGSMHDCKSWRSCHPARRQRKGQLPAFVPSHALAGCVLCGSLAADATGPGARGWTAATAPTDTAGFVLGILDKSREKKEKRKRLLHFQKEKEGEHDGKDKAAL